MDKEEEGMVRRIVFLGQPHTGVKLEHADKLPAELLERFNRLRRLPVIAFDTETTGLSRRDKVIQLGWSLNAEEEEEVLLTTEVPINPRAASVHGIYSTKGGLEPRQAIQSFYQMCKDHIVDKGGVVVAHNASFDVRMLTQTAGEPPPFQVFCTLEALKPYRNTVFGGTLKLEHVFKTLGGEDQPLKKAHAAGYDAFMAAFVYKQGAERGWWR